MNLMAFLNKGAKHAPSDSDRHQTAVNDAAEASRQQWLSALTTDQIRAWDTIGKHKPGVLEAMATMLTIAGFAHVYDKKSADTPDLRVIRGAVSAATQCAKSGGRVTVDDARAFSAACVRAAVIIKAASVPAIIHAAVSIRAAVGMGDSE